MNKEKVLIDFIKSPSIKIIIAALFAVFHHTVLAATPSLKEKIEAFITAPDFGDAELSPSGKYIAIQSNVYGSTNLLSYSIADNEFLDVSRNKIGHVGNFEWVDDELLVYEYFGPDLQQSVYLFTRSLGRSIRIYPSLVKRQGEPRISNLAAVKRDKPRAIIVSVESGKYPKIASIDLDILVEHKKLNVTTLIPHSEKLARGWWHDADGQPRIGFDLDEDSATQTVVYVEGDTVATVASGPIYSGEVFAPIHFDSSKNKVWVEAYRDNDNAELFLFDPVDVSFSESLLADPDYDIDGVAIVNSYTHEVIGYDFHTSEPKMALFNNDIENDYRKWSLALPKQNFNKIVSVSQDTSKQLILSFNDKTMGTYYLFDRDTKSMLTLFAKSPFLDDLDIPATSAIEYQSADGLLIHAYLTRPSDASGALPLIVLPHGGPVARDRLAYNSRVKFIASLGFAVLQPNYRMSEGFGSEHFTRGLKESGNLVNTDLIKGIDYLANNKLIDPERVCMVGGSYGAYTSLSMLVNYPDRFRCGIVMAGFYDITKLLKDDKDKWFYPLQLTIYGDPEKDKEMLIERSPITHLDKLEAELMIVHGARDQRVLIYHAEELMAEMDKLNKPYHSFIRADEGHSFSKKTNLRKLYSEMAEFLEKNLR